MKNIAIQYKLDTSVLPFVNKPGRYLGNELNTIHKDPSSVDVRFAIAFPEVYEIAMSSQSVGILYHLLNRIENVWAERVFAPWPDMENLLRENETPLYTLESFTDLREMDVVGFTLQYELTYSNILTMLDMSNIPLWAKEREENDPLVIAGGPCSCNPEPLADFMDAFYLGDAEQGIEEFCRVIAESKKAGLSRYETLQRLAGLRGVYVPSFYKVSYDEQGEYAGITAETDSVPAVVQTQILPELSNEYYPQKPLVPLIEVTHNRLAVEVMRGCTEGCRYCNAGMIYRPTRERNDEEIVEYTQQAMANTGYEEVSFLSLSISDYSALNTLMRKQRSALEGKNVNFSFPSMRLDSFSEEIAEFARNVRKSGFTFAPEAGSVRLRSVINKNISDEDLMKAVTIALENGWKLLKFYFMIGLPTETMEDVEAIADMVERVVKLSKAFGRISFHVSVSPHSPKSHTPFQWERQDTKEEFEEKIGLLRKRFYRLKQIKFSWRDPEVSEVECILGRGDRRLSGVIHSAWLKGAKFDGWNETFSYETWQQAFAANNIPMDMYTREIPHHLPLPWDHIDKGVTRKFLERERKNAYREQTIVDCKDGTCFGCGIQRKNSFREFAECYTNLDLHKIGTADDEQAAAATAQTTREEKPVEHAVAEQPEKKVFRVQFGKQEYAMYLGHLDVMRAFDRACRMAQVPVLYSQGFNPRPKMSFGQPLALGCSSEAEFVDMEIDASFDGDLQASLNPVLPEGLKILAVQQLHSKVEALSRVIAGAEFEIGLQRNEVSQQALNDLLARESITVVRKHKGKDKEIDIRPYIDTLQSREGNLFVRLRIENGKTSRMNEVLESIFNAPRENLKGVTVHRKRQLIKGKQDELNPLLLV